MGALFKDAILQLNNAVLIVDQNDKIVFVNKCFLELTGYKCNDVDGKKVPLFIEGYQTGLQNGEVYVKCKDKEDLLQWLMISPTFDKQGNVQQKVLLMSNPQNNGWDALTKLPNRNAFYAKLRDVLDSAGQTNELIGILYIDIDRFKFINDTLGHFYGDLLLKQIATRMKLSLREDDIVSRMGGDEFVCLLTNLQSEEEAEFIAEKILGSFKDPFHLRDTDIHTTASIGISFFPYDGDEPDILISNADIAMYRAKKKDWNCYEKAKVELHAGAYEKLIIENDLRKAIEKGELSLYFQPQMNLKSNQITSMEALLRWEHPSLGMISPADFIPIAEETGLMIPIGDLVLRTACWRIKEWERAGFDWISVAVNLSAHEFLQKDMVEKLKRLLHDTGIRPNSLELEITESVIMHDVHAAVLTLKKIKDLGIKLSIDDFGTGYSSLSYLKQLPVDHLKIDRSFISDIDTNPSSKALTNAITMLAHDLHLKVIAEGIETYNQLSFVKKSSCDAIQGYYLSKPMKPESIHSFLKKHNDKAGIRNA